MSRVERTETPGERRGSDQLREAERARRSDTPREAGHTPTKAEGEESDVEEALRRQNR